MESGNFGIVPLKVREVEEVRRGFLLPGLPEGQKQPIGAGLEKSKDPPSGFFRSFLKTHLPPGFHAHYQEGNASIFKGPLDHKQPAQPSSHSAASRETFEREAGFYPGGANAHSFTLLCAGLDERI